MQLPMAFNHLQNAYDDKITIERLFIAVYALNFICLPECKFTEFMKYKICKQIILPGMK